MEGITQDVFGHLSDGTPVLLFTLNNDRGVSARVMNYGATLVELMVPDRDGRPGDVVLGFDAFDRYPAGSQYFGCIVGRVANRIRGARFCLDGTEYTLTANDGANHLHGGEQGFGKVMWQCEPMTHEAGPALSCTYTSADGEEGYPGTLTVTVNYILTRSGVLRLEYRATADKPTPVNLTNHSYYNLACGGTVLEHILTLRASRYTEPDASLTPTGRILPVAGTPLDFTRAASVGGRMGQLETGGYDHNYVIDPAISRLARTAELYEPQSGRVMEVYTTEPGIQLYTGNFLNGITGKAGRSYARHSGLCLETQHFPDAVHQPEFPSVVLRPDATYTQVTEFAFSAR